MTLGGCCRRGGQKATRAYWVHSRPLQNRHGHANPTSKRSSREDLSFFCSLPNQRCCCSSWILVWKAVLFPWTCMPDSRKLKGCGVQASRPVDPLSLSPWTIPMACSRYLVHKLTLFAMARNWTNIANPISRLNWQDFALGPSSHRYIRRTFGPSSCWLINQYALILNKSSKLFFLLVGNCITIWG